MSSDLQAKLEKYERKAANYKTAAEQAKSRADRALYQGLARQVADGTLSAPVARIYPIEEIKAALVRAQQGGRSGKVVVLPNGPL